MLGPVTTTIGRLALLVPDQDAARDFYVSAFGWRVLHDSRLEPDVRLLHVGPALAEAGLWLLAGSAGEPRPDTGHPAFVLYTDELDAVVDRLAGLGSEVVGAPVGDPGERFAHVRDPWGNRLVVTERPGEG